MPPLSSPLAFHLNQCVILCLIVPLLSSSSRVSAFSGLSSRPQHVALICDGNSRWAKQRHLPASIGHAKGADALTSALRSFKSRGVRICTFYGFSSENWSRSAEEIRDIWTVMERTAQTFHDKAMEENVCVRILGDLDDDRIPRSLKESLVQLERDTGGNADFERSIDKTSSEQQLLVCLAINYGGRRDIVNAGKRIAELVKMGDLSVDEINEDVFEQHLWTSGVPAPDFVIRTGGERRLSNFLLWNLAYSEIYFTDELWPDFDAKSIDEALAWYASRSRRFGGRDLLGRHNNSALSGGNESDNMSIMNSRQQTKRNGVSSADICQT